MDKESVSNPQLRVTAKEQAPRWARETAARWVQTLNGETEKPVNTLLRRSEPFSIDTGELFDWGNVTADCAIRL